MRSSMNAVSGERPKILTKMLQATGLFSTIVFLGALYYTAQIIGFNGPFAEHTRISEHALMPGLVTERFNKEGLLSEYLKSFSSSSDRQKQICGHLHAVGIRCHEQNWSLRSGLTNRTGQNVYGVVRARRSTGVEAMLLAVEIEHKEAVALMLAYAAFAREQVYWARDIFFVFVDGGAVGMDAFLSKYQLVPGSQAIEADDLWVHGGSLIGGIVLKSQKTSGKRKTVKVQLNQLNGQLPNLDLFNSIVRIASMGKFGLETVIYDVWDTNRGGRDWSLLVPLRAVYTQAFVAVEGTHSVFGKYGVQGLSLALPPASSYSLAQSTRLVEAVARSLNNILERFHQSYFMYILTSEENFLSIAYYMPCMAVVAPLLMFVYREWVHMTAFSMPFNWFFFHLAGAAVWLLSSRVFISLPLSDPKWTALIGLLLAPLGLVIRTDKHDLPTLRFLVYLEFALAAMSLSLVNFGMAFICSAITVPLFVRLSLPTYDATKTLARTAGSFLLHPLSLYLLFLVYLEPYLEYKHKRDFSVEGTINLITTGLARLLQEQLIFGSHAFTLLCLIALPLWNSLVAIVSCKSDPLPLVESSPEVADKKEDSESKKNR